MAILPIGSVPNRPAGNQPRAIADILGDFDHVTNYIDNILLPNIGTGDAGYQDVLQQGVISGGVVTRDSSSQVTTALGTGWVTLSSGTLRRISWVGTVTGAIPVGVINGRVDQIVVDLNGTVTRLQGTNAAGLIANLDDANAMASRAALPAQTFRLWEFVVDNTGVVATVGTKFRDRRPWAKGADSYADQPGSVTIPAAVTALDVAATQRRVEIGSTRIRITIQGVMVLTGPGVRAFVYPYINGVAQNNTQHLQNHYSSAQGDFAASGGRDYTVTPGSQLISLGGSGGSGVTASISAYSIKVEELLTPASNNGLV